MQTATMVRWVFSPCNALQKWVMPFSLLLGMVFLCYTGYAADSKEDSLIRVTRVIDGDTYVIEGEERVRMLGLDAPELRGKHEYYSQESKLYLKELIEGRYVTLRRDSISPDKDRYGRLLRYTTLDSIDVHRKMILEGYAGFLEGFDVDSADSYRKAQAIAQASRLGIWGDPMLIPQDHKPTPGFPWLWFCLISAVAVTFVIWLMKRTP